MTWSATHRRGDVLRTLVEVADIRRDGTLPLDLPGVAETFEDDLALVSALQLRWHTRLSGRIERTLLEQPTDLEAAVVSAWRTTAADLPGVRAILDAHTAHPISEAMERALRTARRKDWVLLAAMAGRAGASDAGAARVGRRIEAAARAAYDPAATAPRLDIAGRRGDSLLHRLLDKLAV